jgi:hypothetical protein
VSFRLSGDVCAHGFVSKHVQGSPGELSPQYSLPPPKKNGKGGRRLGSKVGECGCLAFLCDVDVLITSTARINREEELFVSLHGVTCRLREEEGGSCLIL